MAEPRKVVLVEDDDWCAIYVDGHRVYEADSTELTREFRSVLDEVLLDFRQMTLSGNTVSSRCEGFPEDLNELQTFALGLDA